MNFSNLEKASKLFQKVQQLDQDIIKIEAYAQKFVNGEFKINLNLGIIDLSKKDESKTKVDSDIDCFQRMVSGDVMYLFGGARLNAHNDDKPDQYYQDLDETEALHILGCLLSFKKFRRKKLVQQIENLKIA